MGLQFLPILSQKQFEFILFLQQPSKSLCFEIHNNQYLMSKKEKDIFAEIGINRDLYKELAGVNLRSKNHSKTSIPQSHAIESRPDDKKKVSNKYTPPHIIEKFTPPSIQYDWFKETVLDIFQSIKTEESKYMKIQLLYYIFIQVNKEGGVIQLSSIGSFSSYVKNMLLYQGPSQVYQDISAGFLESIRQLLFSIQFILKTKGQRRLYELGLINFIQKDQLGRFVKNISEGLKYFNHDLTLFQEGGRAIKIDQQIFNLDYMCKHYGDEKIDIRIQNPLDYGFKPTKLKNKKYEMTLKDYRFYQTNFMDPHVMNSFSHAGQLAKGQVFFGVNFQPSDQMLNEQIKKSVQGTFLDFHAHFDLLSYLDKDVTGCSLPQMYFKTYGVWTGGHQQNICMSALNINHGPDSSQWFTLEHKYVEKLRKQLVEKYGTDLYSSEGLWYERLQWFIERGYPVKRFLQRKDDIVITGPGTLHWVRSFGVAIQTSWNLFPKTFDQFEAAFSRHKINKEIKFNKSDTIPLKSLIIKYLNHQRTVMEDRVRKLCVNQLEQWFKDEVELFEGFSKLVKKIQVFYLKDLQSFCCLCRQEVLAYFLPAPSQMERGISCLSCYKNEKKKKTLIEIEIEREREIEKVREIDIIFIKTDIFFLQTLIKLCKDQSLDMNYKHEISQLCKGHHVGLLPVKCENQQPLHLERRLCQFGNESLIQNKEKEAILDSKLKYQIYEHVFNRSNLKTTKSDRPKPFMKLREKMMIVIQEQGKKKIQTEDKECQTDNIDIQLRVKEEGEISEMEQECKKQGESDKQKKKKKKKKEKKEKKKSKTKEKDREQEQEYNEEQSNPSRKFKSSSQENMVKDSKKKNRKDPSESNQRPFSNEYSQNHQKLRNQHDSNFYPNNYQKRNYQKRDTDFNQDRGQQADSNRYADLQGFNPRKRFHEGPRQFNNESGSMGRGRGRGRGRGQGRGSDRERQNDDCRGFRKEQQGFNKQRVEKRHEQVPEEY